jgi:hypothetical protein
MADGDEEKGIGLQAVLAALDPGITHAVPALIAVQGGLAGLPAGIPHAVSILDIIIPAPCVHGNAVIPVTQDAAELGVPAEAITACGVGNEGEEILRTHVVDPRPGRIRPGYHIFAGSVLKMSECLHCCHSYLYTPNIHIFSNFFCKFANKEVLMCP